MPKSTRGGPAPVSKPEISHKVPAQPKPSQNRSRSQNQPTADSSKPVVQTKVVKPVAAAASKQPDQSSSQKKPLSAYQFFTLVRRAELKDNCEDGIPFAILSKQLGNEWNDIPPEKKIHF